MSSNDYLSREDNMDDLIAQMPELERTRYSRFGHHWFEPAFVDRKFVVYKVRHEGSQKINEVTVEAFDFNASGGAQALVREEVGGRSLVVTHVPVRLFEYPIYISVPPYLELKWDARTVNGAVRRSLSFGVFLKTKNAARFNSIGNTYIRTLNDFRAHLGAI